MRVSINLATKPFVNLRPFLATAGLFGGLVVVVTAFTLLLGVNHWNEYAEARAKMNDLETKRLSLYAEQRKLVEELSRPQPHALLERKLFLDDLIRQRQLSWIELFFDLQEHMPERVRIVSLSPTLRDDGGLLLEMRVAAGSAADLISFLSKLEEGSQFQNVVLRNQQEGPRGSSDGVLGEVGATYSPRRGQSP